MFRKNSGIENFQAKEGGSFTVLSKIFSSHRTEKTSPGNHSVFQKKFLVGKTCLWIGGWGGGGYHDFPSKLLSHCSEIFHCRTNLVFQKILLLKIFMHRRGASRSCRKFLSHKTEAKSFEKEPLCFPEIFWYRKNLWIRGGISRFSVKISMCNSAENFHRHPFIVSENLGYR